MSGVTAVGRAVWMVMKGREIRGEETNVSIVLREVEGRCDVRLVVVEGERVTMVAGSVDE